MTLVYSCIAQGAETGSGAQDGPPRTAGRNGKGNRLGHFWKVTEVELIHLEGYRLLLASDQAPAACIQKWAVNTKHSAPAHCSCGSPFPPPTKTLMKHAQLPSPLSSAEVHAGRHKRTAASRCFDTPHGLHGLPSACCESIT
jgi:hypothetical protein